MARLLLVDDARDQTTMWRLFLESSGHHVEMATTLNEAIGQLSVFEPHILVMDLCLPSVNEGLTLIREAAARCSIKILVLSGWPQDLEQQPERQHVHKVLVKPVKPPILLRIINDLDITSAAAKA
jgi:CheY-like chemotaxis protein